MKYVHWYLVLGFIGLLVMGAAISLSFFLETRFVIPLIGPSVVFMSLGFFGYFYRLKNPDKFIKEQVTHEDERLKLIRGDAGYMTFYVSLVIIAIIFYVALVTEVMLIAVLLGVFVFIHLGTYLGFYFLFKQKY